MCLALSTDTYLILYSDNLIRLGHTNEHVLCDGLWSLLITAHVTGCGYSYEMHDGCIRYQEYHMLVGDICIGKDMILTI